MNHKQTLQVRYRKLKINTHKFPSRQQYFKTVQNCFSLQYSQWQSICCYTFRCCINWSYV